VGPRRLGMPPLFPSPDDGVRSSAALPGVLAQRSPHSQNMGALFLCCRCAIRFDLRIELRVRSRRLRRVNNRSAVAGHF
jgi:hypothetical protein